MPKLTTPLLVIAGVTSSSTQAPTTAAPAESRGVPEIGGALLQVRPDSLQGVLVPAYPFETAYTDPPLVPAPGCASEPAHPAPPLALASVTRSRSVARTTLAPPIPAGSNLRYPR